MRPSAVRGVGREIVRAGALMVIAPRMARHRHIGLVHTYGNTQDAARPLGKAEMIDMTVR